MSKGYQSVPQKNNQSGNPVSLFPFLAVLLCTMGSLLGVLLLMADLAKQSASSRQAAEAAASEIQKPAENLTATATPEADTSVVLPGLEEDGATPAVSDSAAPDSLQAELAKINETSKESIEQKQKSLEEINGQIDKITQMRKKLEEGLTQSRLQMSGVEADLENLRKEYQLLGNDLDKINGQLDLFDDEYLREELAKAERELSEKQLELEGLREKTKKSRPGLAVIPHHGQINTTRYPIYILCTAKGVALQPEGIVLSENDFACNLSLGSPLEAALRAKREYLLRQKAFDPGKGEEPYPLILVSPDGIEYYYAARAAISAYGNDFGYKLIDSKQEQDLVYPPVDDGIVEIMNRAIAQARLTMKQIAVIAPATESAPDGPVAYRVNGSGSRQAVSLDQGSRVAEALRRSRPQNNQSGNENRIGNGNGNGQYGPGQYVQGQPNQGTNGAAGSGAAGNEYRIGNGSGQYGPGQYVQGQPNQGTNGSAGSGSATSGQSDSLYAPMVSQEPENAIDTAGSRGVFGGLAEAEKIDPATNSLNGTQLATGTGIGVGTGIGAGTGGEQGRAGQAGPMIAYPAGPYGSGNELSGKETARNGLAENGTFNSNQVSSQNPMANPASQALADTQPKTGSEVYSDLSSWQKAGASSETNNQRERNAAANAQAGQAGQTGKPGYSSGQGTVGGNQLVSGDVPRSTGAVNPYYNPLLATPTGNATAGSASSAGQQTANPGGVSTSGLDAQLQNPNLDPNASISEEDWNKQNMYNQRTTQMSDVQVNQNLARIEQKEPSKQTQSLADRLGPNWAVPEANRQPVSLSRGVSVEFYPDRFVVRPTRPGDSPRTILIGDSTEKAVEPLITAIQKETSSWGDPGSSMYWKPFIRVKPQPGGEARVSELRQLLDGSGIEFETPQ